jgi:hypothetical protein
MLKVCCDNLTHFFASRKDGRHPRGGDYIDAFFLFGKFCQKRLSHDGIPNPVGGDHQDSGHLGLMTVNFGARLEAIFSAAIRAFSLPCVCDI